jgi:hypothetical protein
MKTSRRNANANPSPPRCHRLQFFGFIRCIPLADFVRFIVLTVILRLHHHAIGLADSINSESNMRNQYRPLYAPGWRPWNRRRDIPQPQRPIDTEAQRERQRYKKKARKERKRGERERALEVGISCARGGRSTSNCDERNAMEPGRGHERDGGPQVAGENVSGGRQGRWQRLPASNVNENRQGRLYNVGERLKEMIRRRREVKEFRARIDVEAEAGNGKDVAANPLVATTETEAEETAGETQGEGEVADDTGQKMIAIVGSRKRGRKAFEEGGDEGNERSPKMRSPRTILIDGIVQFAPAGETDDGEDI